MIITIDGPSASGKSFLANQIANKLGIYYLNSGFLFRAVAYVKLHYPDLDIKTIFQKLTYCYETSAKTGSKNASVKFQDQDITPFLKTPEIDNAASHLSNFQEVRLHLLDFQRALAKNNDLITDGRDCGSVVFVNADVKIYLTASLQVRAQRWQSDMQVKGLHYTLKEAEKIVYDRDFQDQQRHIAPLVIPENAIILDNSNLTKQETLNKALEIINLN